MTEHKQPKKWYYYLLNKYILVGGFFVVWMIFFDQNSYLLHQKLNANIESLENDKNYFQEQIDSEATQLNQIKTHPEESEKMAREKYLMKRDNEDIFVIVEEKDTITYD